MTIKEVSVIELMVIAERLKTLDINVKLTITREKTVYEFPSLVLIGENYNKAIENLLKVRKMLNSSYLDSTNQTFRNDYILEVGYFDYSPLLEIKPKYSYNLLG